MSHLPLDGKRAVLPTGTRVLNNKYEVLKCIHNKGMANVYMVRDTGLGGIWCMKEIIRSEAGKKNIEYISLLNEADVLRKLSNPNIPRIVQIAVEDDSLIIIMDWIEGITLSKYIDRHRNVSPNLAINWMKQLCKIMIYLHSKSQTKNPVFYRDMKSDNIIIQSDNSVKILDFGVSVIIDKEPKYPNYPAGTIGFAPPEQRKKDLPCDLRSDIYATGMTFYHMLTGINPANFEGQELKPVSMLAPDVPTGLERIVSKCIRKDPNDRYQSFLELLYDLNNYHKLEDEYRKKAYFKIKFVGALYIASLLLMIVSLLPYNLDKTKEEEQYQQAVIAAEQSSRSSDYEVAIGLKPTEIYPYFGYIDTLKTDGEFSVEEENSLLNFLNPNLPTIRKDKDYGRLAYEVGKLYWFYYSGGTEDEAKLVSTKWFQDAVESGYNTELAEVYYQLGVFKKDIAMSVAESEDAGMYKEYWDNLKAIRDIDIGDVVTLQINLQLAECISGYSYNLRRDGVLYEDIMTVVSDLESFVSIYSVGGSSNDSVRNLYEKLEATVPILRERVNAVYSVKGD